MPRTIPSQLVSHLAGSSRTTCILVKVTPVQPGYAPYGVTTLDRDVTYDDGNGELLYSAAIGAEPTTLETSTDLNVAGGESRSLVPVFDTPVSEADLVRGAYDFARFIAYLIDYEDTTPGRHVILQTGTLGRNTVTDNGLSFTTELRGLAQNLKQSITEKWSIGCRAKFGSLPLGTVGADLTERFPCNFDTTALWVAGTVSAVGLETTQTFTTTGVTTTYGGNPGLIRWLTGNNAGREDEVDQFDDVGGIQTISLTYPAMFPIEAGDTFEFRDDCPKTKGACKARANWHNYRGEPNIPVGDAGQASVPGASAGIGTGGRTSA